MGGGVLHYGFGVTQILIKTYGNTQKLKIKSEYFLFKKLAILSLLPNSYVCNNDSIMYPETKH